jgi:hypothetical protein
MGCPTGVPNRGNAGAGRGAQRGPDEGQTGPDGGRTGCPTGATRGPDGARRGQTGWRTEGLFTFKRKIDMFCIRVM